MFQDGLLNKVYFQLIGTVNFAPYMQHTVRNVVKELKESQIKRILLVIQEENMQKFMKEVPKIWLHFYTAKPKSLLIKEIPPFCRT